MMNTPVWCVEDGVLLQKLRQNAKIDDLVFARTNAISVAQLRELEGQGQGSFYNAHIKTNTGHKLLRKLGHEPTMRAPEPTLPAQTDSQVLVQTLALSAIAGSNQASASDNMPYPTPDTRGFHAKWLTALLLLGGLGWTLSLMPWSELIQQFSALRIKASTPPQAQQASPDSLPVHNSLAAAFPNPTPPATAAPTSPIANTSINDSRTGAPCDWRQHAASAYEPTNPIKAGNYIHFVATQDVNVCVRDQKNQSTNLQLKAGSAQSVYGESPFLVHSPSWQNLQVFFQGRRVVGTPDGAASWLFKSKEI